MTEPTKTCRGCGQALPLEAFPPLKSGRYGVHSLCRPCKLAYQKRLYQRRKQRQPSKINYVKPPPGLKARLCWSAQTNHHGARNENCRHYLGCLNVAARHNLNFSCAGCQFEHDQAGAMIQQSDLPGVIALLWAVKYKSTCSGRITRTVQNNFIEFCSILAGEEIRDRQADYRHYD